MAKKNKESVKVKPCPFCTNLSKGKIDVKSFAAGEYQVVCGSCGAIGPLSDDPHQSLELWNTRTTIIIDNKTFKKVMKKMKEADGKVKDK